MFRLVAVFYGLSAETQRGPDCRAFVTTMLIIP